MSAKMPNKNAKILEKRRDDVSYLSMPQPLPALLVTTSLSLPFFQLVRCELLRNCNFGASAEVRGAESVTRQ